MDTTSSGRAELARHSSATGAASIMEQRLQRALARVGARPLAPSTCLFLASPGQRRDRAFSIHGTFRSVIAVRTSADAVSRWRLNTLTLEELGKIATNLDNVEQTTFPGFNLSHRVPALLETVLAEVRSQGDQLAELDAKVDQLAEAYVELGVRMMQMLQTIDAQMQSQLQAVAADQRIVAVQEQGDRAEMLVMLNQLSGMLEQMDAKSQKLFWKGNGFSAVMGFVTEWTASMVKEHGLKAAKVALTTAVALVAL